MLVLTESRSWDSGDTTPFLVLVQSTDSDDCPTIGGIDPVTDAEVWEAIDVATEMAFVNLASHWNVNSCRATEAQLNGQNYVDSSLLKFYVEYGKFSFPMYGECGQFYYLDSHNAVLCGDCATHTVQVYQDENYKIVAWAYYEEGPSMECEGWCNDTIRSNCEDDCDCVCCGGNE